jgi:hypothetical protein
MLEARALLLMIAFLWPAPIHAQSPWLKANRGAFGSCISEAFSQESSSDNIVNRKTGFDCIGLVARSTRQPCTTSPKCVRLETDAWLALARGIDLTGLSFVDQRVFRTMVGTIERQANALCRASAAISTTRKESAVKNVYTDAQKNLCVRDAVAGMVVPLVKYSMGN